MRAHFLVYGMRAWALARPAYLCKGEVRTVGKAMGRCKTLGGLETKHAVEGQSGGGCNTLMSLWRGSARAITWRGSRGGGCGAVRAVWGSDMEYCGAVTLGFREGEEGYGGRARRAHARHSVTTHT